MLKGMPRAFICQPEESHLHQKREEKKLFEFKIQNTENVMIQKPRDGITAL